MPDMTVAVPVTLEGAVFDRLGKAPVFATCSLRDGEITDWVAHPVGWDQTYGVDVLGAHHARVMRFVQDHAVTAVVADDVCDSMRRSLESQGVAVYDHRSGDARTAVESLLVTA